jgi:hypothetical protein
MHHYLNFFLQWSEETSGTKEFNYFSNNGPCHVSGIPLQNWIFSLLQRRKTALHCLAGEERRLSFKKGRKFPLRSHDTANNSIKVTKKHYS